MSDSSNLRDTSSGHTDVLLSRARSGSEEAWNILYLRYRRMLIAHVQARIPGLARRRFDAEDVLQTAVTRAWQNLDTFQYDGEGSFRRWLATLVVNSCLNELRGAWPALEVPALVLAEQEEREAHARNQLDETRSSMLEAMGQLSAEDRDILIQRHIEELSFDAIAEIQSCTREKARALYASALERLERRMGA